MQARGRCVQCGRPRSRKSKTLCATCRTKSIIRCALMRAKKRADQEERRAS